MSRGMLTGYDPTSRSLHLLGLYEREIYDFLQKGILRSRVLVDIGANDGYYALAFLRNRGKEVLLCEPGVERFDLISNLRLNGFVQDRDYTLVDKFVSAKNSAQTVKLNDLIRSNQEHFVLMDIEGAELEIILNFDFGETSRINWLIETHGLDIERQIVTHLRQHQYKVHIIKQAWWRSLIPEQRPLSHNRWLYAERN